MEKGIFIPDQKDKKLLLELDFHSRVPVAELARKIRLSKQATEYRIGRLVREGVVKGFYPIINMPKLGYTYCRIALSLQHLVSGKEEEIIEYLNKSEQVFWVFTAEGYYDLLIALWVRNLTEFRDFINELITKFGEFIRDKTENINTEVIFYQHRFFFSQNFTQEIILKETEERAVLDPVDRRILQQLCQDARQPLVKIGESLKLSPKVVAYHLRNMEKNKIILGYRPVIDFNRLGYAYYKVWIKLEKANRLKELYTYLKTFPSVLYVIKGIGFPGDLDLELIVKSNLELYQFISELKRKFPEMLGESKIFMFMETKKVKFLPF